VFYPHRPDLTGHYIRKWARNLCKRPAAHHGAIVPQHHNTSYTSLPVRWDRTNTRSSHERVPNRVPFCGYSVSVSSEGESRTIVESRAITGIPVERNLVRHCWRVVSSSRRPRKNEAYHLKKDQSKADDASTPKYVRHGFHLRSSPFLSLHCGAVRLLTPASHHVLFPLPLSRRFFCADVRLLQG
jgi:hypothetical protein